MENEMRKIATQDDNLIVISLLVITAVLTVVGLGMAG